MVKFARPVREMDQRTAIDRVRLRRLRNLEHIPEDTRVQREDPLVHAEERSFRLSPEND